MKCYMYPCQETATEWMTWQTTGRPKGAPVCPAHKEVASKPDNWGTYPTFETLAERETDGFPVSVAFLPSPAFYEMFAANDDCPYGDSLSTCRCPV